MIKCALSDISEVVRFAGPSPFCRSDKESAICLEFIVQLEQATTGPHTAGQQQRATASTIREYP